MHVSVYFRYVINVFYSFFFFLERIAKSPNFYQSMIKNGRAIMTIFT